MLIILCPLFFMLVHLFSWGHHIVVQVLSMRLTLNSQGSWGYAKMYCDLLPSSSWRPPLETYCTMAGSKYILAFFCFVKMALILKLILVLLSWLCLFRISFAGTGQAQERSRHVCVTYRLFTGISHLNTEDLQVSRLQSFRLLTKTWTLTSSPTTEYWYHRKMSVRVGHEQRCGLLHKTHKETPSALGWFPKETH